MVHVKKILKEPKNIMEGFSPPLGDVGTTCIHYRERNGCTGLSGLSKTPKVKSWTELECRPVSDKSVEGICLTLYPA